MTTASETSDVLLLGATGNSGRLIAAELAARGLSVRLAGRRRGPLEDLARAAQGRLDQVAPGEAAQRVHDLLMDVRASLLAST